MVSVVLVAINGAVYVRRGGGIDVGGEWSIVWEGSVGRLLDFLGVALGAVVVCVGAMDSDEVVAEVGVCGRMVVFVAESVANGWVGRVA